jgi:hypothetical protein
MNTCNTVEVMQIFSFYHNIRYNFPFFTQKNCSIKNIQRCYICVLYDLDLAPPPPEGALDGDEGKTLFSPEYGEVRIWEALGAAFLFLT